MFRCGAFRHESWYYVEVLAKTEHMVETLLCKNVFTVISLLRVDSYVLKLFPGLLGVPYINHLTF